MPMGKKATKEKSFLDLVRLIQQNTALYIIALNRHFGIGAKRLNAFLDFYEQLNVEFQGYDKDGVVQEKLIYELKSIGIEPSRIFEDIPKMQEFRPKKQNISMAEQRDIEIKMKALDLYKKDLGGINID